MAKFVEIVGIADTNPQAPGILLAKENGLTVTTDMYDLLKGNEEIDIVIDVTGMVCSRCA